jgi:hypothetical protein
MRSCPGTGMVRMTSTNWAQMTAWLLPLSIEVARKIWPHSLCPLKLPPLLSHCPLISCPVDVIAFIVHPLLPNLHPACDCSELWAGWSTSRTPTHLTSFILFQSNPHIVMVDLVESYATSSIQLYMVAGKLALLASFSSLPGFMLPRNEFPLNMHRFPSLHAWVVMVGVWLL